MIDPIEWLVGAMLVRAAERAPWRSAVRDSRQRFEIATWLAANRYLCIFPPDGWTLTEERYWREMQSSRE